MFIRRCARQQALSPGNAGNRYRMEGFNAFKKIFYNVCKIFTAYGRAGTTLREDMTEESRVQNFYPPLGLQQALMPGFAVLRKQEQQWLRKARAIHLEDNDLFNAGKGPCILPKGIKMNLMPLLRNGKTSDVRRNCRSTYQEPGLRIPWLKK